MKKNFLIAAMLFVGMVTFCYGQDVRVNINNQDYSSNGDCDFKINGICSSEDIGGVDVEFREKPNDNGDTDVFVVFTNYNNFPVTVLSVFEYMGLWSYEERTLNCVLQANKSKEIKLNKYYRGSGGSVKGMIVRKLAQ